jgi:hypothetical protein
MPAANGPFLRVEEFKEENSEFDHDVMGNSPI